MTPKPFNTNYLEEQDGHKIYFAEYGNPNGEALVVLHGGPGSKSKPSHAEPFDLQKFRVITFDQRGCGQSQPAGEIKTNTTDDLISDLERLRTKLNIQSWFVSGSSWGSTLALIYGETHPQRVRGLLLSSIFLARPQDAEWAFTKNQGVERMFPDLWEKRLEFLRDFDANPDNASQVLLKKMNSASLEENKKISAGVINWEGNLMSAQRDVSFINPEDISEEDIASTKIFLHYEANNFFLTPNQILNNLDKLQSTPVIIVHGRYDILCPVEQTWELQKHLTNIEIVILPTSNHKFTADGGVAKKFIFKYFLEKYQEKKEG